MKFPKAFLRELILCYSDVLDGKVYLLIENPLTHTSRWSEHYRLVFCAESSRTYYAVEYSQGATECQSESPFDYDPELIECEEVFPFQMVNTVYLKQDPSSKTADHNTTEKL